MQNMDTALAAGGRLLIAALFLVSGVGKIVAPAVIQGYIASAGLPAPLLAYLIVRWSKTTSTEGTEPWYPTREN
jgi:putative oxidoreductase